MKLTTRKPAPSTPCMICAFAKTDLYNFKSRIVDKLTGRRPQYVSSEDYKAPDTLACAKAMDLVRAVSPEFLTNHCWRSHALGLAMAHKINQPIDREVYFLGAILHDLGLTPAYDTDETFELSGAKAARAFCIEHKLSEQRADLVHEMVALHNSVGLAHKKDPEIALIHFGAGADVAGLWIDDVDTRTLHEIMERYPNDGFTEGMIELLQDQIDRKPQSYMSTMIKLGFVDKMRQASQHLT